MKVMNAPEHDPTARAAAGDLEAQHLLLERHLGSLRSYIRVRLGRKLRDKETSLDLSQSVCRQVLQNFDAFDYRGEPSFRNWLLGQAENKIRDRQRFWHRTKRDRDREESTDLGAGGGEVRSGAALALQDLCTPSRHVAGREEIVRLEEIFARLPEDFRTVIQYARIQGLSHQEIADRMGRSKSATRTLLCRALARLANEFDGEGLEEDG
ncbi:MAG: RNA polymerase sigma factor (sigma-70 family) [Planctomycetota bacterium]|jgi:RNA polymerase sigma factor (sigma-70 family)